MKLADFEAVGRHDPAVGGPLDQRRLDALADGTIDLVFDEGIGVWFPEALEADCIPLELDPEAFAHLAVFGWRASAAEDALPAAGARLRRHRLQRLAALCQRITTGRCRLRRVRSVSRAPERVAVGRSAPTPALDMICARPTPRRWTCRCIPAPNAGTRSTPVRRGPSPLRSRAARRPRPRRIELAQELAGVLAQPRRLAPDLRRRRAPARRDPRRTDRPFGRMLDRREEADVGDVRIGEQRLRRMDRRTGMSASSKRRTASAVVISASARATIAYSSPMCFVRSSIVAYRGSSDSSGPAGEGEEAPPVRVGSRRRARDGPVAGRIGLAVGIEHPRIARRAERRFECTSRIGARPSPAAPSSRTSGPRPAVPRPCARDGRAPSRSPRRSRAPPSGRRPPAGHSAARPRTPRRASRARSRLESGRRRPGAAHSARPAGSRPRYSR